MAETDAFDHESLLARLPARPGVYRMIDGAGDVLYVGKARNLKSRVTSYFRASGLTAKTMSMVAKVGDIQITVTGSETEALLLEQSLIKSLRPTYNVTLRDDKSYPYIHVTEHRDYPRLSFHRGAKRKHGRYFGPFPSASAVRESINILQKLFQLRSCEDSYFKNRSRPCLQHQIGRCTAPCVGLISPADYAADVRRAELFLEGRSHEVLEEFKQEMERAAQALDFERAARYRDQIAQLRKIQEQQYVHSESGDVDVFAIATASGAACIQGLFIRGGRLLGHRNWFPRNELALTPADLLGAFLSQFYLGSIARDMPRSIIVSEEIEDASVLAAALTESSRRRVEVSHRVRGQRARWLDMARENAQLSIDSYLADKQNVYARFVALQEALALEDTPRRLECFDVSHSSGEATVASCVVFDQSGPLKSDYRRFNIEGVAPGDDYAAIGQALRRRYHRLKEGEGRLPDLLVIDGGPGQVGQAQQVLEALQVDGVQVLGIAKGTSRKPGLETLHLAGQGEVALSPQGAAMHLLQHIRDEAHRFAVTGHRQRRDKARRISELDSIPGIGPKRKRELLRHFGSLAGVQGASIEEIAKLPGISRKLAEEIYGRLHPH
jgi:excinuclease ABC subunit C